MKIRFLVKRSRGFKKSKDRLVHYKFELLLIKDGARNQTNIVIKKTVADIYNFIDNKKIFN